MKNKDVTELLLPGTHNAGANQVNFDAVPVFWGSWFKRILYELLKLIPLVKKIISGFVINQSQSVAEQLEHGVRFFDFRLGKDNHDNLYLSHTFLAADFDEVIEQLIEFLSANPKEIIVFHLRLDEAYKGVMTQEDIKKAFDKLKALELYIYQGGSSVSINNLHKCKKNIILSTNLGESELLEIKKENGYELFKESLSISNPEVWPNRSTVREVLKALKNKLEEEKEEKEKYTYASLIITPCVASLSSVKSIFTGGTLAEAKTMNQSVKDVLAYSSVKKISALMLDAPDEQSISLFIQHNRKV